MPDSLMLPLFLLNTLLIIIDASYGYHLAPRLLRGLGDPKTAGPVVGPTRALLSAVVALYMFFNCRGYYQSRPALLLLVLALVMADMLLQKWLIHRKPASIEPDGEE
jgi:hypothetical protein